MNYEAELFHESLLIADDTDATIRKLGYTREALDAFTERVLALPCVRRWMMRYTWEQLGALAEVMAELPCVQAMFATVPPAEVERLSAAFQYWLLYLKSSAFCDDLLHDTPPRRSTR